MKTFYTRSQVLFLSSIKALIFWAIRWMWIFFEGMFWSGAAHLLCSSYKGPGFTWDLGEAWLGGGTGCINVWLFHFMFFTYSEGGHFYICLPMSQWLHPPNRKDTSLKKLYLLKKEVVIPWVVPVGQDFKMIYSSFVITSGWHRSAS